MTPVCACLAWTLPRSSPRLSSLIGDSRFGVVRARATCQTVGSERVSNLCELVRVVQRALHTRARSRV